MFREARKLSGKAITAPSSVPRNAIAIVSPITLRNSGRSAKPAGGKSCATTTAPNFVTPCRNSPEKKPNRARQ